MAALSPSTCAIRRSIWAIADATAASSAARSRDGSPVGIRRPTAEFSRTSGPAARPGEAGRPLSSSGAGMGWLPRRARRLVEVARDEGDKGVDAFLRIIALGPEVEKRVFRRLCRHDLDDALGVDPRALLCDGKLDAAGKGLGELRQFYRRPRVQAHRMGHHDGTGRSLLGHSINLSNPAFRSG